MQNLFNLPAVRTMNQTVIAITKMLLNTSDVCQATKPGKDQVQKVTAQIPGAAMSMTIYATENNDDLIIVLGDNKTNIMFGKAAISGDLYLNPFNLSHDGQTELPAGKLNHWAKKLNSSAEELSKDIRDNKAPVTITNAPKTEMTDLGKPGV